MCPICGSVIREAALPQSPEVPLEEEGRGRKGRILLAIVLVTLASGSIGGYYVYDRFWANNPVANAATEPGSASKAVDSLTLICWTTGPADRTDPSMVTGWFMLGVRNRSGYPMDTKWMFSSYYPSANVSLTSSQSFHLAGIGDAYPKFPVRISSVQIGRLNSVPYPNDALVVSVGRTFNVTGIHGIYHLTRYDTGSGSNRGTGILAVVIGGDVGKVLGPPPCP